MWEKEKKTMQVKETENKSVKVEEMTEKNGGRHVLFDLENSDIVNVEDI